MRINSLHLLLLISFFRSINLGAQETDLDKMGAQVRSYEETYLSEILRESTNELDDSISQYVMTNDHFLSTLRDSLRNAEIYSQDYARGADLNLKYRNYDIRNLVHVDMDRVFVSLRLRPNLESDVPELREGIGLLGRLRDNFYVIFVLNKNGLHLNSTKFIMNAYSELYFNKANLSGTTYLWALQNESSLGGGYSSVVLRVMDPRRNLNKVTEQEIYASRWDMEKQVSINRTLRFSFFNDTLHIYGTQYTDGRDSTVSEFFKIPAQ